MVVSLLGSGVTTGVYFPKSSALRGIHRRVFQLRGE